MSEKPTKPPAFPANPEAEPPARDPRAGLVARTEAFVRALLEANACGHDYWHIHRVRNLAIRIAPEIGADPFLVEMGAVGIARTFAYGGSRGHAMHDPYAPVREGMSQAEYRDGKGRSTSVNHFHEKLLRLKDRMNTPTGRALAEERHRFMVEYLERFHQEWDGNR